MGCCFAKNCDSSIIEINNTRTVPTASECNANTVPTVSECNANPLREPELVIIDKPTIIENHVNICDTSIYMVNYNNMKRYSCFPRYPNDADICTNINDINRETSLLIYISHNWYSNLHPDNTANEKFHLMLTAIEQIKQLFAKHMSEVYVWVDFSCINQDTNPAKELKQLDRIVQFCDLMLTPLLDNCGDWELLITEKGWFNDYKSIIWKDGDRAYVNRAWCRLEMLYCLHIPLKDDINKRIYKCQSALAHAMLANRRPHFIYGTKEKEENRPPICLSILDVDVDPLKGTYTIEQDSTIVSKLLNDLQPYINEKSYLVKSGYIGDKNDKGLRHGNGKYIYNDGAVFSGEFRDDMRYNGTLVTASGECFVGEFRNEQKNGVGKCTFTDGSLYEGEFENDKKHGHGTLTLLNGDKFVGNFNNGVRCGEGTAFSNGVITYTGTWKSNLKDGRGKFTWPDGKRSYEGEWKLDKMDGVGTMTYSEGTYTGTWKSNLKDGTGKFIFSNGDVHEGLYVNGKKNGKGMMTWQDGRCYIGDFKDDKREGRGIYTWSNGTVYEGMFANGKRNGSGCLRDPSGRIQNGRWKDDKFIS